MIDVTTFVTVLLAILTPVLGGYGAVWVYFQKQQAQIVRLLEARLSDKDKQIEQLLTERSIFQGLAWDAVQGTKLSTENTHRALSLTEKLQAAQGTN